MSRASATGISQWMTHLPFVLLGLRTSIRADSDCSPSDVLYGGPLRLPGDFLTPASTAPLASPSEFSVRLRSAMSAAKPLPVLYHGGSPSRTDPALRSSSHAFLRIDAVKRPLVPPYEGPFPVVRRSPDFKTFVILRKNKEITVSVDRLKSAFSLPVSAVDPVAAQPADVPSCPPPSPRRLPAGRPPDAGAQVSTSSGRISKPVNFYQA